MNTSAGSSGYVGWRIPTYLAVVLIILFLCGAAVGTWWWLKADARQADTMIVDGSQRGDGGRRFDRQRDNGMGRDRRPSLFATAGGMELRLSPGRGDRNELRLRAAEGQRNDQQDELLHNLRHLTFDTAMVKRLQLTEEQVAKLKQLKLDEGLGVSDADRSRLEKLGQAWQAAADGAAKDAARKAVMDAMTEIGVRSVEPAKKALQQAIEQAKAMLTPAQWEQTQRGNNRQPVRQPTATKPAAA